MDDLKEKTAPSQNTSNQTKHPIKYGEISRRTFMLGLGAFLGVKAAEQVANRLGVLTSDPADQQISNQTAQPEPYQVQLQKPKVVQSVNGDTSVEETKPVELVKKPVEGIPPEKMQMLQKIADMPLGSNIRNQLEENYVVNVDNFEQIDAGLWVVNNPDLRAQLMRLRYNQRPPEGNALPTINKNLEEWAIKHNIHPETMGLISDNYKRAEKFIQDLLDKDRETYRGDLYVEFGKDIAESVKAKDIMMNAGAIAALIDSETRHMRPTSVGKKLSFPLAHIGQQAAKPEINDEVFPSDKEAINILTDRANKATGLKLNPDNQPGSAKIQVGMENSSGGAWYIQTMPSNLLRIISKVEKYSGVKLNPVDPDDLVVAAIIFESMGEKVPDGIRGGWLKSIFYGKQEHLNEKAEKLRRYAVHKWNPWPEQINYILELSDNYYDEIIAKVKNPY